MMTMETFKVVPSDGAVVSIIYDTYSSGWQLFFGTIAELLERGKFVILSNYNQPLKTLFKLASAVGIEIEKELKNDNMAIIDVFGSKYEAHFNIPNVYYLQGVVDVDTINPKILSIFERLQSKFKKRGLVRAIYALEGATFMFGEEETLKLINADLAHKSKYHPDTIFMFLMNSDILSKKFIAWVSGISDYVIVTKSKLEPDGILERLYVVRSPDEGFRPLAFKLHVADELTKERIKIEKLF